MNDDYFIQGYIFSITNLSNNPLIKKVFKLFYEYQIKCIFAQQVIYQ